VKSIGCSIALLLITNFFLTHLGYFQFYAGYNQIDETINYYFYAGDIIIGVLIGIYWDRRVTLPNEPSASTYNWIKRIVRFSLAWSISQYGFAKLLKTQFTVSDSIKDIPIGEQSGFWLTWYYFGYSYTFAVIIGLTQIIGSILLLFNRTRLLGTFVLLPVMINIVFVNIFYDIHVGAFTNSLIYTAGLIFLLLLNYNELRELFFPGTKELYGAASKNYLINAIRVLTILMAFLPLYLLTTYNKENSFIKGVYKVDTLKSSQHPGKNHIGDSVLTKIYFDYPGLAILEFNGHERRKHYYYSVNKDARVISLIFDQWTYNDSLKAEFTNQDRLVFKGLLKEDTLEIVLKKVR
jgi:hypothetical protein